MRGSERARDPDDDVVEAAYRAAGDLARADGHTGEAPLDRAGGAVGDHGHALLVDVDEQAAVVLLGGVRQVEGAQAHNVRLVDALDPADPLADCQVPRRAVAEDLSKLVLALPREDVELVARAAAAAQDQRDVGPWALRLRRAAQQPAGGDDLEVAAHHRRAVGALLGALADRDLEGARRAAAIAVLARD